MQCDEPFPCPSLRNLPVNGNSNIRIHNSEFNNIQIPGNLIFSENHCFINGGNHCQAQQVYNHILTVENFISKTLQHTFQTSTSSGNLSITNQPQYIASINYVKETNIRNYNNSEWIPAGQQVVFGQIPIRQQFVSLGTSLSLVAHEFYHGLIDQIIGKYGFNGSSESAALEESLCDIFAVIVCNQNNPNRDQWDWTIGRGFGYSNNDAMRDINNPKNCNENIDGDQLYHPVRWKDYRHLPDQSKPDNNNDFGWIHYNCSIHNQAAYNILMAKRNNQYLFTPQEVAQLFYLSLISTELSTTSTFADSRRAILKTVKKKVEEIKDQFKNVSIKYFTLIDLDCLASILFLLLSYKSQLKAIGKAFDSVGITDDRNTSFGNRVIRILNSIQSRLSFSS